MDDAAFESRRSARHRRSTRIRVVGFSLLGVLMLSVVAGWLAPAGTSARQAARWRRLQRLTYPPPPTTPGVHALRTEPHPSLGGTILFTPPMPVEFDGPAGQGPPVRVEIRDRIAGTTRVEPVRGVTLFFRAAPRTWPVHDGKVLVLVADGEQAHLVRKGEYSGEGWGLAEGDLLTFEVPTEFFLHMAAARRITGVLDGRPFTVTPDEQAAMRDFAAYLRPGIAVTPPR